jgi:hypothetical protein
MFGIKIDITKIEALANRVGSFDAAAIGRSSLVAVNEVATYTHKDAIQRIVAGVNLTEPYVRDRLTLTLANSPLKPVAQIVGRFRPSNLISYDPSQLQVVVNWTNATIRGNWAHNPRAPEKSLPWKFRKGNPARGIPVDMKAAGVKVEVARGAAKPMPHAFVIIGRGGKPIVASRDKGDHKGKGEVHAKTGLSVYQLFGATLKKPGYVEGVADRLTTSVVTNLDEEIKKVFG